MRVTNIYTPTGNIVEIKEKLYLRFSPTEWRNYEGMLSGINRKLDIQKPEPFEQAYQEYLKEHCK